MFAIRLYVLCVWGFGLSCRVFHLVTHGFFKALLFLSAGSVIHACHEQDIFKMGGLRKKLPITYANFGLDRLQLLGYSRLQDFIQKI